MNRSFTYHNRSCGVWFFDLWRHSISHTKPSNNFLFFPSFFSFRFNNSWKRHQIRKVYRFLCFTTKANIKYKRNSRLENNSNKIHSIFLSILFNLSFLSITLLFQMLFKEQTQKLEGRKKRKEDEMNCIVWITR